MKHLPPECAYLEDYGPPTKPKKKTENPRIIRRIAELYRDGSYTVELNIVQFFDHPPAYDIRRWHQRSDGFKRASTRGIQLTEEQARALKDALEGEFS